MAKRLTGKWNVFSHFKPYRKNNSPWGIRESAKTKKRIDLDFQETLDEIWAWTHWGRLWIEGFRYTEASLAVAKKYGIKGVKVGKVCRRTVKTTPYALIATLKTKDGHTIGTAGEALELAASLDVQVEVECKGNPSVAMFTRLKNRAKKEYGEDRWQKMVQVKRLWSIKGWSQCLHRASNAGFTTILINYKGVRPGSLPTWVKWYRRG